MRIPLVFLFNFTDAKSTVPSRKHQSLLKPRIGFLPFPLSHRLFLLHFLRLFLSCFCLQAAFNEHYVNLSNNFLAIGIAIDVTLEYTDEKAYERNLHEKSRSFRILRENFITNYTNSCIWLYVTFYFLFSTLR